MEPDKLFTGFFINIIKARLQNIQSIQQLHEYINTEKLPDIDTIVHEGGLFSIDLFLYILLLEYYNIELSEKDVKYLSATICLAFPEFTLADIYYVFANDKKYYLRIRTFDRVCKRILQNCDRHQSEKIIYMHLVG